jgi:hypothetical protein
MKIKVNDEVVEIFQGAQVKDVIRSYSNKEYKKVKKGEKIIQDQHGNMVMPNGELIGDEEFFIVDKDN